MICADPKRLRNIEIEYPCCWQALQQKKRCDRMPKLLDAVGLAGRAKNLPGQSSGGRRQRADLPRLCKVLAFGHINLRYGPGYGYNSTDFFRDDSRRVQTTADPFALRENRLGPVMLHGQRLWTDGPLSVFFTPKLADCPNP